MNDLSLQSAMVTTVPVHVRTSDGSPAPLYLFQPVVEAVDLALGMLEQQELAPFRELVAVGKEAVRQWGCEEDPNTAFQATTTEKEWLDWGSAFIERLRK
ncbi:hypothetical protein VTI74DRAFT_7063 [Chaetomium olivicolor]